MLSASNQILSENSIQECSGSISITEKNTEDRITVDTEVCTSIKLSVSNDQDLMKEKLTVEKNKTLTENIIHQVTNTPIIPRVLQEHDGPQLYVDNSDSL